MSRGTNGKIIARHTRTQLDAPLGSGRIVLVLLEMGKYDALRVLNTALLHELCVEDFQLAGVVLLLGIEHEDDPVGVTDHSRPTKRGSGSSSNVFEVSPKHEVRATNVISQKMKLYLVS